MKTATELTQENSQKFTEESHDISNLNSELIKRHEIENAPWGVIEHENGYFLALGQHKLTENFETLTEAIEHIKTGHFTMQLIITLANAVYELKQQ